MTNCDHCGTLILFGGIRDGSRCYCSLDCRMMGPFARLADEVPSDMLTRHLEEVHQGDCPKCGGPGPVDVHQAHSVQSAIVITRYETTTEICCRACGDKMRISATLSSCLLGWWGIPVGVFLTPVQIARNLAGLFWPPNASRPSAKLEDAVRLRVAGTLNKPRRANDGIVYEADDWSNTDSSPGMHRQQP